MQKKIIALAVAGLMSGATFAQSNVTVYGQVNMGYQNASGHSGRVINAANNAAVKSLANLDSRLGFKGEEALGNGLKAVFTLEYDITPDGSGTNQTSNSSTTGGNNGNTSGLQGAARQSFAGLSGSFGTVTWGRQYTPFFEAAAAIDPFGVSTGNVASAARINPIAAVARADNSFKYVGTFPVAAGNLVVAGLMGLAERTTASAAATAAVAPVGISCINNGTGVITIRAACLAGETGLNSGTAASAGVGDTGKVYNWKLAYASGPLLVGVTGIKLYDNAAGTAAVGTNTKALAVGGTYDLGKVKLAALYDRVDVDNAAGAVADRRDWMLGATIPMGVHTFRVGYSKVNDKMVADNDAKHWGLSYNYTMSKRTYLFANYGKITNDNGASFAISSVNSGVGTLGLNNGGVGSRTQAYQLGMAHSF